MIILHGTLTWQSVNLARHPPYLGSTLKTFAYYSSIPRHTSQSTSFLFTFRDYHVWDAGLALARMWSQLPDGASMVEGSCDIHGSRLAAVLLRGGEQRIAGFLFAADVLAGSRGPSNAPLEGPPPSWFERYIPRLWLKGKNGGLDGLSNAEPGGERPANAVHAFLRAWSAAANETAGINGDGGGVWQWFRSSTRVLREMDDRVDTTMAEHGLLVWWAQEELPMYHPKAPAPQEESLSKDYRERQP